jgi:GT2 family glycosyltransferase
VNGYPDNPYSEASQALQSWLYAYFAQTEAPWRFFASNNLSAPAERIRALGGFDTETLSYASEDRELCGRWIARGWGLTLVPEARVVHFHRLDALGFAAQHFAYGRGAHRRRLARRRQGLPALPGDRTWMLASLTRYPFAPPRRSRGLALASLAALTHVANAAGYWVERLSARGR